jgi:hypothetical protein
MQEPRDQTEAANEVAKLISEFRAEVMEKYRTEFEREIAAIEAEGFDPALGRGRGPRWANGG